MKVVPSFQFLPKKDYILTSTIGSFKFLFFTFSPVSEAVVDKKPDGEMKKLAV